MWLKKYWPALLAIALQAESLWKFLKWALDWRGRYDALAETYHEIGGASAVIGYILDPPPWFYPLAFLAGLILIWWNFHRNREQANAKISPPHDKTPAAKPEATAKQERVFVPPELTPERLFSFYRENTAIQGDELTKHFVGQWIKVTGTLNDVSRSNDFRSQVTFERSNTPILEWTWLDYTTIYMWFREPAQIDRLKILRRGDKITVNGQVQQVQNVTLHLDNCELAD
jgi:tRNA_anti-like